MSASSRRVFQSEELLVNLAEQVKLPFLQIAYAAERLEDQRGDAKIEQARRTIVVASQTALKLIDGYLLSIELQKENSLALEPVALSSVLYDAAQDLSDYAKAHNCELELQLSGKYGPAMAHRRAVTAALTTLGMSFIESASAKTGKREVVRLAVNRRAQGLTAGVYIMGEGLSDNLLKRARAFQKNMRQPLAEFDSGSGTGVFIAGALFDSLHAELKVSRLRGFQGLAATLPLSRQLSLV